MKLVLPLILTPLGLAVGLAAGQFLKPAEVKGETPPVEANGAEKATSAEAAKPEGEVETAFRDEPAAEAEPSHPPDADAPPSEYVKLNRQFVVPVIEGGRVAAMMVLSLAVEVPEGGSDAVFSHEPKLRDAFLRVLFTHAQSGGFSGVFTRPEAMADLRGSLLLAARKVLGASVHEILLTNLVRQDV